MSAGTAENWHLCLWNKVEKSPFSAVSQLTPKLEVHNHVDGCPSVGLTSFTAFALCGAASPL